MGGIYHQLMRNAKLPFIIQLTNLIIGINQTTKQAYYYVADGG